MEGADGPTSDNPASDGAVEGRVPPDGAGRPWLRGLFFYWPRSLSSSGSRKGFLYWLPILAAALGGFALGSYFLLASMLAQQKGLTWYAAGLFITGILLALCPVTVIWLLSRWGQEASGDESADPSGQE